MRLFKTLGIAAAALVAVGAAASSASAESLLAAATRKANDSATTTHVFKALNDAGGLSLGFSTSTANALVKITYNAECGVLGAATSFIASWVSVTILVDGVQADPATGKDFALCTATDKSSATQFDLVGAVRQSFIVVPNAGLHTVKVLVDLNGFATKWWLGDTSIAVEQK